MKLSSSAQGVKKITVPTPFEVGPVNLYVLRDGDCVTLVDTGPKQAATLRALEAGLQEHGLRVEDVTQVVLTHFHADHVGLLEEVVKRSQAKVYAHPYTGRLISQDPVFDAGRHRFFVELYQSMGVPREQAQAIADQVLDYQAHVGLGHVDVALAEGDRLPGHEQYSVVYTPGHAQDHISLYDAQNGVMVLGDHLIGHISSNAFVEPPMGAGQARPKTLLLYREALRNVRDMDWTIGYSGHGEEITEPRALIDRRLAGGERRAAKIADLVKSGKRTGLELALTLFPLYTDLAQMPLILSETLGHLDLLEAQGLLTADESDDGVLHYREKASRS